MYVPGESFWGCSKCQLGMRPSIVRYTTHGHQDEDKYRDTLSSYIQERKILHDKKKIGSIRGKFDILQDLLRVNLKI